ncbi:MAG TPA: FHA domain-containing serine/threonine-protein kinase [Thermoanaerobaculia bacterium]|jgi:serine/threonine-protein kinase|nr:FHA domain-containing serine/threonine-protein kinase [Thermoanaerobaculia bacterium]
MIAGSLIGTTLGNYRIEREIGEGGMSHVYVGRTNFATDVLPVGFPVVLKVMTDELAGDITARKRFIKEASILSKLRHRYITRFYEFINNDSGAVLVMEFVEGTPVDLLLTERGALPLADAIVVCQCLLEALVYAHGKGIVHRDIKPANLIREKGGPVKVTDFGIAKIKEGAGMSGQTVLTKSGFLLGTPHYMSPEQIREPKDAGAKSDIYSSGVVLYEMLTGALPFNSRSLPKLIDAIYRGEKQAPSALRPEVDKELEDIVVKAMHPRMDQRFETAREFFEALEEYTARQPIAPTGRHQMAPDMATPQQMPAVADPRHWTLVNVKPETNEKHAISGDSVMVGRDRTCSIVLAHPAVSRRHARITVGGNAKEPVLEDLQSANGTYVNNTRIDRTVLKPGDIVRFGADPACSYVLKDR